MAREKEVMGGARFYVQQDMTAGELTEFSHGTAVVYSTRAPGKETANEDAAALIPYGEDAAALVVADGLGGHAAGAQASGLAIQQLEKSLRQAAQQEQPLRTAILNGIEAANKAVAALANGSATTLSVVEIQGHTIRPYHIGDSMILVTGQRGKVKHETISHSPVGYAVEAGMLDAEEAMHHEERHVVSNIIGTPEMRIEIGPPIDLATYDTLLIATDGLADNLHVEEIVERIRKGPLNRVASTLAEDCHTRMSQPQEGCPSKPDDCSFVLFRRKARRRKRAKAA